MATPALPDQFAWRPHAGSDALTFRGKIAGLVSPLPDGRAMTSRSVGTVKLTHEFHSTPETGCGSSTLGRQNGTGRSRSCTTDWPPERGRPGLGIPQCQTWLCRAERPAAADSAFAYRPATNSRCNRSSILAAMACSPACRAARSPAIMNASSSSMRNE